MKKDLRKNIILIFLLFSTGILGCGSAGVDENEKASRVQTVETIESGDMTLRAAEVTAESDDSKEEGKDLSEKRPEPESFTEEVTGEKEPDIYNEAHGFSEDMSDEEPEGADVYETGEEEPYIKINVINMEVMTDVYNDLDNANLLRLALQTYFYLATEDEGQWYDITLLEGSCKDNGDIITLKAEAYQFPGTVLYIEYDKKEKDYGIDSDFLDASLKTLRENR